MVLVGKGEHLIYFFENHSLDTDRRELRRGGQITAIGPQVFDVLEYLIRNRERVVSDDDLIEGIWRGRIFSESTLSSRITAARQAIGDSGEQQNFIRTLPRKGFRFIAEVREERGRGDSAGVRLADEYQRQEGTPSSHLKQTVTFCRTKDDINLAVASVGRGPMLVRAGHWGTNIEYDLQNPLTGPLLQRLSSHFHLVRYDGRGTGLSDRDAGEISFATFLDDLETVVDSLAFERFVLLGMHGGAAVSIAYAVRHPHRVSKLMLCGGYAQGHNRRGPARNSEEEERQALLNAIGSHWDPKNTVFMRAFTSLWLPSGTPEQVRWLMDLARVSHSREDSAKFGAALGNIDVVDLLSKVATPTIVFHSIRDHHIPFDQGRRLACSIPNARFVPLDSENHALLSIEPAWARFVEEMEAFLSDGS
jgi:DNA-binding winged helix-turn-helix (wHTH) protein/pimeloyl-ACP methyl ester carboxylesterase